MMRVYFEAKEGKFSEGLERDADGGGMGVGNGLHKR